MSHLAPETFIDLLDGTIGSDAVPHLATCAACQARLADLRATSAAAADVDVPEPSPLFWDHLSRRVHEAVATEPTPRRSWRALEWSWPSVGFVTLAAACVALLIAIVVPRTSDRTAPVGSTASVVSPEAVGPSDGATPASDDESLGFMADLASNLDWDGVSEVGLAPQGSAERATMELNDGERTELKRLLDEAIQAGSGRVEHFS